MLVYAAVRLRAGDLEDARRIFAATGADVEEPFPVESHRQSLVALSLAVLEPMRAPEFDEAARDGRRIGSVPMATALVAAKRSR